MIAKIPVIINIAISPCMPILNSNDVKKHITGAK